MDTSIVAALSAFGGAVIGALTAALSTFIAQRAETRRTHLVQQAETERTRLVQEAETRRYLRAALLRAAEWVKNSSDQAIRSFNESHELPEQLINLSLTDYILIAIKFEHELQNLDSMDDEHLMLMADKIDQTFTELLKFRIERVRKNRAQQQS